MEVGYDGDSGRDSTRGNQHQSVQVISGPSARADPETVSTGGQVDGTVTHLDAEGPSGLGIDGHTGDADR